MKVFLEKVNIGTESEGVIYEFLIHGRLNSNQIIYIHDDAAKFDLRNFENQVVEILLVAHNISLKTTPRRPDTQLIDRELKVIKGNYLGRYVLPNEWHDSKYFHNERSYKYWHHLDLHAIKTEKGIFLITNENAEKLPIEKGEKSYFYVDSFYMIAWHPIE